MGREHDGTRVLLDYKACYEEIIALCEEAREAVYITAWLIDFNYPMNGKFTMLQLIERMCARGVQVHILLTPNVLYDIKPPEPPHELCAIKTGRTYGPRFSAAERLFIRKQSKPGPDYDFKRLSLHQKYLVVDGRRTLISSVDVSKQRCGSEITGETNADGYIWAESAVVTDCDEALWAYCRENFATAGAAELNRLPWLGPFATPSREARVLCDLVRESERLVYIENQYLGVLATTEDEHDLLGALSERLARAIRDDEQFFVVIVTNYDHVDSNVIMRFTLRRHLYRALADIRRRVTGAGVSAERLRDHLAAVSLNRNGASVYIHAKVLIQDGRQAVVSSSNLIDRSLSLSDSDRELGVLLNDAELAGDLLQRLVAKHLGEAEVGPVLEPEQIFELARSGAGHFTPLPPDAGGLPHDLAFRVATTILPSLG